MSRRNLIGVFVGLLLAMAAAVDRAEAGQPLPDGFVDVAEGAPGLVIELRYLTAENFVGTRVDGYVRPRCILTREAAAAIEQVQAELSEFGLGLKIFDAYRPQRAVDHFVRWARDPKDTATKPRYYPEVEKRHLFRDGYVAARSSHSRGSTVDLTIVAIGRGKPPVELDMGTPFDFFGRESSTSFANLSAQQRANRLLLQLVMQKHGFRPYAKEWWHFTLDDEPFPNQYFDFPVR